MDGSLGSYLTGTSLHKSFCLLTDRRNLVLAVNTADFPGNECAWYNPDLMENRQRAVFMAGCDVLDGHADDRTPTTGITMAASTPRKPAGASQPSRSPPQETSCGQRRRTGAEAIFR